jgi:hypothetical protein
MNGLHLVETDFETVARQHRLEQYQRRERRIQWAFRIFWTATALLVASGVIRLGVWMWQAVAR